MRMIVIKQATDLQSLGARLLVGQTGGGKTLETMKQLNPHVDFSRIAAGSVLLVPEASDLKEGESQSISGEAFDTFAEQALAGLDTVATRVGAAHAKRLADQKELGALLKSAPLKRAIEADAELKAQVDATAAVFKEDQAQAKAADEALKVLKAQMSAELAALGKLLG